MAEQQLDERPIGELVQQLTVQTQTLVRQELQLARLELREKGKRAGIGAGMFGGSGLFATFGLGALVAAAILGLATELDPWLAALIVAGALFLVAAVLALTGKRKVEEIGSPAPEGALAEGRQTVNEVKARTGRR